MTTFVQCVRGLTALAFVVGALLRPVFAQTPQAVCESFGRSNVDCACVSKRMEAYIARAKTPEQSRYITESYKADLGLPHEREAAAEAVLKDQNKHMEMVFQYEGVGGVPGNIDDFEDGCVIAGAPLTPVPNYTPGPVRERYMEKCLQSVGDRRGCQCTLASIDNRLTEQQFQYLMVSRIDADEAASWSTLKERYEFVAKKSGTTVENYKRVEQDTAAILKQFKEEDEGRCNALLAHDQDPGRTAEERAGTPLGFENPGEVQSLAAIKAEQDKAGAEASAMASGIDPDAMMADAQAQKDAFEQQRAEAQAQGTQLASLNTPRALFDTGCAGTGNEPGYCTCLSAIYDEATSDASDGVSRQLALLMVGGGLSDSESMALMSSAKPADLGQASQIFGGNMMRIMSCN